MPVEEIQGGQRADSGHEEQVATVTVPCGQRPDRDRQERRQRPLEQIDVQPPHGDGEVAESDERGEPVPERIQVEPEPLLLALKRSVPELECMAVQTPIDVREHDEQRDHADPHGRETAPTAPAREADHDRDGSGGGIERADQADRRERDPSRRQAPHRGVVVTQREHPGGQRETGG
jgi:hypothetical protein